MKPSRFLCLALLAFGPVTAAGEPLTTDRVGETSALSLGFGVSTWDTDTTQIEVTGLRWHAHAQLMGEVGPGKLGGFVTLPVSYAVLGSSAVNGTDRDIDNETDLGNIELGAAYAHSLELAGGHFAFIGRAGVAIGTADDEDTEPVLYEGAANAATQFYRLTDSALVQPDSTWIRGSGSLLGEIPLFDRPATRLEVRADFGIDIPVSDDESTDVDPLLRLNLAAVYHTPWVGLGVELANLMTTGTAGDGTDRFLHTVAVSLSLPTASGVVPTVGVVVPVDDVIRDRFGHELTFAASVTGVLPAL